MSMWVESSKNWSLAAEALLLSGLKLTESHLWFKHRNEKHWLLKHGMAISVKDFCLFLKFSRIILIIGSEI